LAGNLIERRNLRQIFFEKLALTTLQIVVKAKIKGIEETRIFLSM
jgi:DUF1009 family protein